MTERSTIIPSRLTFVQEEIGPDLLITMGLWPDIDVATWLVKTTGLAMPVAPAVDLTTQVSNPGDATTLWTDGVSLYFGATPVGGGGLGTVASVGLAMPSIFTVSGSPVTAIGTLTASLNTQTANRIFAGPTIGAAAVPTFRTMVPADIAPGALAGRLLLSPSSATMAWVPMSGDATISNVGILTLASVIVAGGPIGSSSSTPVITYDAKGRLTSVSSATITPASIGALSAGPVTTSGLTMSTARLLGRTTAATGAVEEISVGPGLQLSAGVLDSLTSGGSVTSVGLAMPSIFSVSGSPVVVSGTLTATLNTQMANTVFAGPTIGADAQPDFRVLGALDLAAGPTSAQLLISQTSTTMDWHVASGDLTMSSSGVFTLNDTTIAGGPIGSGSSTPVITYDSKGRLTSVTTALITPASIGAVATGPVTTSGLTMNTGVLLGRSTAGAGAVEEITVGTGLTLIAGVLESTDVGGTVTSVDLTMPSIFSVSGNPVTSAGTLAVVFTTQTANTIFSGPTLGAAATPTFRSLVPLDLAGSPAVANLLIAQTSTTMAWRAMSGDATIDTAGVLTLTSVIVAGGPTGSSSVVPVITYDANGRLTTVTTATITPAAIGAVTAGLITSSGLTMNTARLLGRTTAATGAIEEITVGAGLTLSAGVLDTVNNGTVTGTGSTTQVAFWSGVSSIAGDSGLLYDLSTNTLTSDFYEAADGTAPSPTYSFSSNINTGMYRVAANQVGISANGTLVWDVSETAMTSTLIGIFPASTNGALGQASIRLPHGAAPTTNLTDGDVWTTTAGMFARINGVTVGPFSTGGGSVTSVGLSLPSIFTVTVSPITTTGTLTAVLANQTANTLFAGPASGAATTPTFRTAVPLDLATTPASGQILQATSGTTMAWNTMSGDATISNAGVVTLASIIVAGGPIGSSSTTPVITYDAKGRLTVVSSATITPAAIGAAASGLITASGLTMSTARLLGRTTAATGAIEEIVVGAGLDLTAGVLSNVGATGTVTSVALALPSIFTVSGSPVTTSGTLTGTFTTQTANLVFAGPASGAAATPTFRSTVPLDLAPTPASGQLLQATSGTTMAWNTMSGDATISNAGVVTLASIIVAGGPTGSSSVVPVITYDAKGRLTTVTTATITPAAIGAVPTGPITTSGLTMATARLLGRTTAATGAIEEITVGTGLTLSAGTLTSTGTVSGSGVAQQVPVWSSASALTGFTSLVFTDSNQSLRVGDGSTVASITINGLGSPGTSKDLQFLSAGVAHWIFRVSGNVSGSDAGDQMDLQARTDAGAVIDNPITIIRAAGGLLTLSRATLIDPPTATGTPSVGFRVNSAPHTALTASVEFNSVFINGAVTQQFATGALATQRFMRIAAPTYGFVAASTITTASTLAISGAPTAGTNATLTNRYALNIESGAVGAPSGTAALPSYTVGAVANLGMYSSGANTIGWASSGVLRLSMSTTLLLTTLIFQTSAGTAAAPSLSFTTATTSGMYVPAANTVGVTVAGVARLNYGTTTNTWTTATTNVWTQGVANATTLTGWTYTGAAHTALTASTEAPDVNYALARTVQFATGALATQRAFLIQAPTYAFVGASTLTDASTLSISGAPVAGTNATITNRWAINIESGAIGNASGTAALPGYAFNADPSTGIYRIGAGNVGITTSGGLRFAVNSFNTSIAQAAAGGGLPGLFLVTGAAHTNLQASSENTDINFNLARTVQWATGTLVTQRAFRVRAPTYAFVGASTLTTASTLAISGAPAAGTNATITNAYALNVESGDSFFGGNIIAQAGSDVAPSISTIGDADTGIFFNGANEVDISTGGTNRVAISTTLMASSLAVTITPLASTGTPNSGFRFNAAAHTALTASTEFNSVFINGAVTQQFATGALATQRFARIDAPTYGFVGASTITNAATLAISGAPVAGTNATITNAYALWIQSGNALFANDVTISGKLTVVGLIDPTGLALTPVAANPGGALSATTIWSNSTDSNKLYYGAGPVPGTGTITSVALAVPSFLSVAGSPITSAGTFTVTLATQTANTLFAGPASGAAAAPTFRTAVPLDLATTPASAQILQATSGTTMAWNTLSGDAAISNAGALTLASVITAGGPTGSTSVVPVITYDAKGRLTTVTTATITPAAIGAVPTGAVTTSGLTMSNGVILGRTTAGTGAIQEITIGSGLSLSAGTLSNTGGTVTGSGTANQVMYWSTSTAAAGDAGLTYDPTIDTLSVGTQMLVGNGSAGAPSYSITGDADTGMYRVGANDLGFATNGTLRLDISTTAITSTLDLKLGTVGNGLYIKEGTNATMGVATLVAGTVVVSTTKVTATSRIFLTRQNNAGTVTGAVDVTARTAGTSFVITSFNALDTSDVAWVIVEPA